jgi:hypothetical protein
MLIEKMDQNFKEKVDNKIYVFSCYNWQNPEYWTRY